MSLCKREAKGECCLSLPQPTDSQGFSPTLGHYFDFFFSLKSMKYYGNFVYWCQSVNFRFLKQQLISRTLENGCAICRRNRLLTCTASSTDRLQSPSFRYSWIQRGILLRLSARANLWTKINQIITTKARWYHMWWRVFKYCGEDKSAL